MEIILTSINPHCFEFTLYPLLSMYTYLKTFLRGDQLGVLILSQFNFNLQTMTSELPYWPSKPVHQI